jgi:hypothetical protein
VRLADNDYREAKVSAYQSIGIGCLLVAVALLIAGGAAVWGWSGTSKTLIPLDGAFG